MNMNSDALSQRFDIDLYHAVPGCTISWTSTRGGDCDECAAVQHETRGAVRRKPARTKRSLRGGAELRLCAAHAAAWRERDEYHLGDRASHGRGAFHTPY